MEEDKNLADLHRWLELYPKNISDNVTIIGNGDANDNVTFHISLNNKLTSMEPRISQRTLNKEDRSVARISTAPTLTGCLSGYSSAIYDFEDPRKGDLGGWKIYQLNYEYALKPNVKLLADVEMTDEDWLVTYNKEHVSYKTQPIGELFFSEVGRRTVAGKQVRVLFVKAYLRVAEGYSLPLNRTTLLRPGHYVVRFNNWYESMNIRSPQDVSVVPISANDYMANKKLGAGLLDFLTQG